ncbi:hypothetical protein BMF77_00357 [Dolichospermum sp. UHCC 0315A]|nr:hypothetical protein BMF77_00357 [Dolichospermum sp. UHCC 0315A]
MNIILDACALIAFFKNELGAEIVENYLSDNQYICMIHGLYTTIYKSLPGRRVVHAKTPPW